MKTLIPFTDMSPSTLLYIVVDVETGLRFANIWLENDNYLFNCFEFTASFSTIEEIYSFVAQINN